MRRLRTLVALILCAALPGVTLHRTHADHGNAAVAFERTWERTDLPVINGEVSRTWMWGPEPITGIIHEPYSEAETAVRSVQYYDKSRMEVNDVTADQSSVWYVTNGLLAQELITGRVQLGDDTFAQFQPADVVVAGDLDDPDSPTYASLSRVLADPPGVPGDFITARIAQNGDVTDDPGLATHGVTFGPIVPATNHAVAQPFWEFMNAHGMVYEAGQYETESLFLNPYFATGFPITEAYWATVLVDRVAQPVLMQCFERRCLTYTPENEPGWEVEAGNVGLHYRVWRYVTNAQPPSDMAPPECLPRSGPDFSDRDMRQPVFAGQNLACADFSGTRLVQPNFSRADLRGADFRDADIQQPIFQSALLNGAMFDRSDLVMPVFEEAAAVATDFSDARLRQPQFVNANLLGAVFDDAELIAPAFVNSLCPDGTNSDANGGTCLANLTVDAATPP